MKRELEGGWFQWVTLPMPAVLTIQSGINQLRYATLKGIMAAKKKEIRTVPPSASPLPRTSRSSGSTRQRNRRRHSSSTVRRPMPRRTLVAHLRDDARVI